MPLPVYQVDAFTDTPFRGNPATVCLLSDEREAEWMQAVAAEMNLLATYWAERLGKREMNAWQASSRGGQVNVRLSGERIFLTGNAVTVLRGELTPA